MYFYCFQQESFGLAALEAMAAETPVIRVMQVGFQRGKHSRRNRIF